MKKEYWKPIKGYEGLYQVSNFGRVKSLQRIVNNGNNSVRIIKERILKNQMDKDGYYVVNLHKTNKSKTFRVHRLVAEAFIPNPDNLPEINHKDENKLNNHVDNLEYCDRVYNINYGTHNERMIKNQHNKSVLQFDLNGNFIREWKSLNECDRNGFDKSAVGKCCKGIFKQRYNSLWKYKYEC